MSSRRKVNDRSRTRPLEEGNGNATHQSTPCHQSAELRQILPKLRPFQREAYEFATQGIVSERLSGQPGEFEYDPDLLGKGKIMLCDEMGLGKTVTSLAIMAHYRREWPLLILCPASLRHTWPNEIEKFMPSIPPSSIYVCNGFNDVAFKDRKDIQVVVVTYSLLQNRSAVSQLLQSNDVHFQAVICDESHNLKQRNSQRSKIALTFLKRANRLLLLSGTPALARPAELWLQLHVLAPDLFGSWTNFTKKYCDPKWKFGHYDVTGLSNAQELHFKLKQVMVRRLKCDVLHELPAKTRTVVPLKITDKARIKANKEIIKELNETRLSIADLVGEDQQTANFEAKRLFNQAYQASGIVKAQAVADYMVDWVAGAGSQKVLVFAHHKAVLDTLELSLSKHLKGVGHIRIDGSVNSNERAKLVRKFQTNAQVRVALLSMTAAGVGLTLTAASNVMFAELHYTPGVLAQAEDRAHRISQRNAVNIMYFVCKDVSISTDTAIWTMLGRKVGNLERIIEGGSGKEKAALASTEVEVDASENNARRSGQEELSNFFAETAHAGSNDDTPMKEPVKGSIMSFFKKASEKAASAKQKQDDKPRPVGGSLSSAAVSKLNNTIVEWECTACTFINSRQRNSQMCCEMCRTPFAKPAKENNVPAVSPYPSSEQKTRAASATQAAESCIKGNNATCPTLQQSSACSFKKNSPSDSEVVVIDEGRERSLKDATSSNTGAHFDAILIDSDDDDHGDDEREEFCSSASLRPSTRKPAQKHGTSEMTLFSVSKNTSRITIHYKSDTLPTMVNFDIDEVITDEASPVQLIFNRASVSNIVYQLDPDRVSTKEDRKQCCEELKEFVSSFLELREVEKRAIKDSGKAFSSKGLRQAATLVMTGVLKTTKFSTERYSGGAKEHAKENLDAGNASPTDLAVLRGDNCAWCAGVLSIASRTAKSIYCSQDCAEEGRLRRGGMYASTNIRPQLFALEGGKCQACGLDAHALYRRVVGLPPPQRLAVLQDANFRLPRDNKAYKRLIEGNIKEGDFWQADHIRAVADGGGGCGLDNFRTLCVPCHRPVSNDQNRERRLKGGANSNDSESIGDGKRKQADIRSFASVGRNKRPKNDDSYYIVMDVSGD